MPSMTGEASMGLNCWEANLALFGAWSGIHKSKGVVSFCVVGIFGSSSCFFEQMFAV